MFKLTTDGLVLGQARLVIVDHVGTPQETAPRYVICDTVAAGDTAARGIRRWSKRLAKKFGGLFGLICLSAMMGSQDPNFDASRHMPMIMGAITSAVATSWKGQIGVATHDFTITTGDTVKTALYTSSATLGASTTAYSATNEISGTGYSAAGATMANVTPTTSGTTAIFDWADAVWTTATFTANGSLSYNSSKSNKAIFVIAFGSDQTVTAGTFTIQWPTADASNAIIRIA